MKDPENRDLIAQIKEVLHAYEEPYMEGAWEQFSGKKKARSGVYWRWAAVAALVLISGAIWMMYNPVAPPVESSVVKSRPQTTSPIEPAEAGPATNGVTDPVQPDAKRSPSKRVRSTVPQSPVVQNTALAQLNEAPVRLAQMQAKTSMPALPSVAENKADKPVAAPSDKFMDYLVEQGKIKEAVVKTKSRSRWDFGVELLPTVSDAALNLGAGVTTAYKLSEHFSVGSGISFVELQAGKALTPGVSLLSTKQLQSVDANFRAIDIPLNIVYNVNKNFYTSVGVSYFNVIEESRKNTFVSERQISALSTDPVTGITANTRTFVSETTQEPGGEPLLSNKSYLGFFNFSIGRKQEVLKKYNVFIEPFIKVPVGKLSQQEIKLMNGGMKFKVAF
jgi:hypothetical protein